MTVCGVNAPGLFHAWGKQVIAGIGWELVKQCVDEDNGTMLDFNRFDLPHSSLQIDINSSLFACLLDRAFIDSKVKVWYHTIPINVHETKDRIVLSICMKNTIKSIKSKILIDATGDANIVELAGYKLNRNKEKQPATLWVKFSGYDTNNLDMDLIERTYKREVVKGTMKHTDTGMTNSMISFLKGRGCNCIHIPVSDPSKSINKSYTEQVARTTVLRIYRFLKQFKGLENLRIGYLAPECGIRETTTIRGLKTIKVEDYMKGKKWDDSICYAFYPIDLHLNSSKGLDIRRLKEGIVPTIPYGALIPKKSKFILVAGRCISSDQLANSALRVQASCMAMGQVAGAAAFFASKNNISPCLVNLDNLKKLLKSFNAIVPE